MFLGEDLCGNSGDTEHCLEILWHKDACDGASQDIGFFASHRKSPRMSVRTQNSGHSSFRMGDPGHIMSSQLRPLFGRNARLPLVAGPASSLPPTSDWR